MLAVLGNEQRCQNDIFEDALDALKPLCTCPMKAVCPQSPERFRHHAVANEALEKLVILLNGVIIPAILAAKGVDGLEVLWIIIAAVCFALVLPVAFVDLQEQQCIPGARHEPNDAVIQKA